MTEEVLDGPDVVVVLEQVGGERVSEGVVRGGLGNGRGTDGVLYGAGCRLPWKKMNRRIQ
jgi:hypothetical protein